MKTNMKKLLILATCCALIGLIVFGSVISIMKWDFKKLSTVEYKTNQYEFTEQFKNIDIDTKTAKITFEKSADNTAKVICFEQEKVAHQVKVENDTLSIKLNDTRKWYNHLNIDFYSPTITVYLPEKEFGDLSIKSSTGGVSIDGLTLNSITISLSTGKINISNTTCAGDIKLDLSTGKTNLTNLKCSNIVTSGTTGNIDMIGVIASGKFSIERSTGDVDFERCDASEIYISTSTGDIEGSLLSSKSFIAKTNTGDIELPQSTGIGVCSLTTTTGDIEIELAI